MVLWTMALMTIRHVVCRISTPLNRYTLYVNNVDVGCIENYIGSSRITFLYVNEMYRGRGYGRILVNHLEKNIRSSPMRGYLEVTSSVSAYGFYEKLGFRKIGKISRWWSSNSVTHFKII